MKPELRITFKGTEPLDHLTQRVSRLYDGLKRKHGDIIDCHVVLGCPHKSKRSGNDCAVSIDVAVPGHRIVGKNRNKSTAGDLFAGLSEAFSSIDNRLSTIRGKKSHDRRSSQPPAMPADFIQPREAYAFN